MDAGYGADALIVDLEDSVPVDRKAEARAMTREFISGGAKGALTYVRVNSVDTGLTDDDLEAIVGPCRGIGRDDHQHRVGRRGLPLLRDYVGRQTGRVLPRRCRRERRTRCAAPEMFRRQGYMR